MRRHGPLLLGVAILLVFAVAWAVPFLDRDRPEISSTPTARPFATQARVMVAGGARACVNEVVFDAAAQVALIQVDTRGRPGPPLRVTATAPGYTASGSAAGGYEDGAVVLLPFAPTAPREVSEGSLCVANGGRHSIGLVGPGDVRSISGTPVTVNGRPVPTQFSVTLMSRTQSSLAARPGRVLEHASAFRPVGRGLLWPLAFLVVLGVPCLALAAVATAGGTRRRRRRA